MTASETSRHLFDLIAAGLAAGPRKKGVAADGVKIGNAIDARVAQLRDGRWTADYTNALTRGAATSVGIMLQNGIAAEWPIIDASMTRQGWVDKRVAKKVTQQPIKTPMPPNVIPIRKVS